MKVRLLAQVTEGGPRSGSVVDLPEGEAVELVRVGYAVAVEDPESVPRGKADLVKAWVGADAERAREALEAERVRPRPRTSLIDDLEEIVGEPAED